MHHTLPWIATSSRTTGGIAVLVLAVMACLAGRAAEVAGFVETTFRFR